MQKFLKTFFSFEAEVGQLFELNIHASRMTDELQMSPQGTIGLPLWLSTDGLLISGTPDGEDATTSSAGQIKAEDESDADATLVILDAQNDLFKVGQTVAIPGAGAGGSTHYSVISSSYIDSDDGDKQKLRLADEASTSVVSADIYQVPSNCDEHYRVKAKSDDTVRSANSECVKNVGVPLLILSNLKICCRRAIPQDLRLRG